MDHILRKSVLCGCSILATWAPLSGAVAQTGREPFSGPYVGAAVGAVDHHFVLEATNGTQIVRSNVTRWGVGGEIFVGYDSVIGEAFRLGAEMQLEVGGREAVAVTQSYTFGIKPRFGYSVSGRIGFVPSENIMIYAGAGYGEHRYNVVSTGNVVPGAGNGLGVTRSFILRSGAEFNLKKNASVRIEFEHLDGSRNQIMIGIPIRF